MKNDCLKVTSAIVKEGISEETYQSRMKKIAQTQLLSLRPNLEVNNPEKTQNYMETRIVYGLLSFKDFNERKEEKQQPKKVNKEEVFTLKKSVNNTKALSMLNKSTIPNNMFKKKPAIARRPNIRASYPKHLTFLF